MWRKILAYIETLLNLFLEPEQYWTICVKFLAQRNNSLSLTGFEPMHLAILRLLVRCLNHSNTLPLSNFVVTWIFQVDYHNFVQGLLILFIFWYKKYLKEYFQTTHVYCLFDFFPDLLLTWLKVVMYVYRWRLLMHWKPWQPITLNVRKHSWNLMLLRFSLNC